MLKRFIFLLLVAAVISSLIGFHLFDSRPDLIARITGRDLLLKAPLAKLVNIEKLYQYPAESQEIKALTQQIAELRSEKMDIALKEMRIRKLESEMELLTGKRPVRNIDDAGVLFRASDKTYSAPRGDSDLNRVFYWEGPFSFLLDEYYVVSPTRPDLFQPVPGKPLWAEGFAVKQVRRWFTDPELKTGDIIAVVGRYSGDIEIELLNRQKIKLPLLLDCYVDLKRY